jgi:hypothetical protein
MKRSTESPRSSPSDADAEPLDELLRHARKDGFTPRETEELWSQIGAVLGTSGGTGGPHSSAGRPAAKAASVWSAKTIAGLALGGAIVAGGLAATGTTRLAWHRSGAPTPSNALGGAAGNDRDPRRAVESGGGGAVGAEPNAGIDLPGSMPASSPTPSSPPHAPRRPMPKAGQQPAGVSAAAESPEVAQPPLGPAPMATGQPRSPPSDTGINEGALLLRARRELGSNPAETLQLTEEHVKLFPAGTLVPEREVLAIEALAQLGRTSDARARFSDFRARFPHSPHLTRLESMLGR